MFFWPPAIFVDYFVPVNSAVISDKKIESASKIHFDTKKKIKKIRWVDRKLKFDKVEMSNILFFLKISKIFEKIEIFEKSRKKLRLNFDEFYVSIYSTDLFDFFIDRSGFSRRIRIYCQNVYPN